MLDLSPFCQIPLVNAESRKSIFLLIREYVEDGLIDVHQLYWLLLDFEGNISSHPMDFLRQWREFTSILFFFSLLRDKPEKLSNVAGKRRKEFFRLSYWETCQLGLALAELQQCFMGENSGDKERKLLGNGAPLLEVGPFALDGAVVQPSVSAELALSWIYLGLVYKREEDVVAGLKVARFLLKLYDHNGSLFEGIWVKESEFERENFLVLSRLLFGVATAISSENAFAGQVEVLEKELVDLSKEELERVEPFPLVMAVALQKLQEQELFIEASLHSSFDPIDLQTGFFRFASDQIDLICTPSGINTGLGALRKKEVHIVSFGPHFYPLSDCDRYGLYRTCLTKKEGFEDVYAQVDKEHYHFQGWSRLVAPHRAHEEGCRFGVSLPSTQWIYFEMKGGREQGEIEIRLSRFSEETPLAFVFFLVAETIVVEDRVFVPRVLEQFSGNAHPFLARCGKEELTVVPEGDHEKMQIIPLAGGRHFWGANFLVAFEMTREDQVLRWLFQ